MFTLRENMLLLARWRGGSKRETGVAKISYRTGDAVLTREVFVSYPDRVMVVRVTADNPGRVSVQTQFKSPYLDRATAKPGKLVMAGCSRTRRSEGFNRTSLTSVIRGQAAQLFNEVRA
jgi:hypothetical protein